MLNDEMLKLGIGPSAIRNLFEKGKELKKQFGDENVFDFSIGNPFVLPPKIVNDTLIKLLNDDNNATKKSIPLILHLYTSSAGDIDVRNAISNYLNKTYNAKTLGKYIYLTTGAAAALTISLKALTNNENNEVIVFTPYFPEYKVFINNANAKMVTVLPDHKTFYPDFVDFENKINKNTNVIIINSPNNPTGVLYNEEIIIKICDILSKKEKEYNHPIYILSDEPYRELIYTNDKYPFITNYYDNSIITYSFSKSISIPGERIGYILANPKCENIDNIFAAICGAGRSLGFVCATVLFQYMIPHVLGYTSDISIYKRNAELLYNNLKNIGYEVLYPDGAFYLFVKALEDDDKHFSEVALNHNLLLVPSESFGINGYVRLAYCVAENQIINSIPKFKELYLSYKQNI